MQSGREESFVVQAQNIMSMIFFAVCFLCFVACRVQHSCQVRGLTEVICCHVRFELVKQKVVTTTEVLEGCAT